MKKYKLKTKLIGLALLAATPLAAVGGSLLNSNIPYAQTTNYEWSDSKNSLLDLPSFAIGGNYQNSSSTGLTGWTTIEGATPSSKGMIIDISSSIFNSYNKSQFYLNENPGKRKENVNGSTTSNDNKILMINSVNTLDENVIKTLPRAKRGYRSNEFTLEANSYYLINVAAKTSRDKRTDIDGAFGSIYLSGLKDDSGKEVKMAFEGISQEDWQTYYFYLATGSQQQTVTIDLYLGRSSAEGSYGAAFFDDVNIEEFSENLFMRAIDQAGYRSEDTNASPTGTVKFLVDGLKSTSDLLSNQEKYKAANLDFEDKIGSDGLTDNATWFITNTPDGKVSTGYAGIFDVQRSGEENFKSTTGFDFVGNDFSYNNNHALALYTSQKGGRVTVENKTPIDIDAHAIVKVTARYKISNQSLQSGSFYVNLVEGDKYYALSGVEKTTNEKSTSAITQSKTSAKTNDWSDITFYVGGRTFYDSEVKLQFCLGKDADAVGCVMVDNITLGYATYDEASKADNFFNLQGSETPSYSDIKNPEFDDAVVTDAKNVYPLSANNWTLTQMPDAEKIAAGTIYLKDQATYEKMYMQKTEDSSGKMVMQYPWAQSYPTGHPTYNNKPNNVYMMYNGQPAYQSIKSESYSLSSGSYYAVNLNYYNLTTDEDKPAQLTIEIVDDNGIVLFKEKIENSFNAWHTSKNDLIGIRTPATSSHNVSLVIHFGTEDDLQTGTTYIDDVSITSSDETAFTGAAYKVDMTDYMFNLPPERAVSSGSNGAYLFTIDKGAANSAKATLLDGENNTHEGIQFEKDGKKKNILAISSQPNTTSTIKSNFSQFKLSTNSYYKLTFSIRTNIQRRPGAEIEQGHECDYGVTVGLTNFDLTPKMLSNDEWKEFSIYFETGSNSSDSKLQFTLQLDEHYEGSAYLTDLNFESLTADIYQFETSKEQFDEQSAMIANYSEAKADDNTEIPDDDEPTEFDQTNWLIIPSLITALAVLIGLVGWALRHVKIKKIEKIKQENYDRKISLDQDAILAAAARQRDSEVAAIKENIQKMQEQKQILEEEHKLAIKDTRLNQKGKITLETEKEFKTYAARMTKLEQKLDILNEQLAKVESDEYLMNLQRQAAADETRRQREAIKKAKAQDKAKEKAEK